VNFTPPHTRRQLPPGPALPAREALRCPACGRPDEADTPDRKQLDEQLLDRLAYMLGASRPHLRRALRRLIETGEEAP
jgi:hypothetical protein